MRGGSGAVYVFARTGATWTREAYLKTWNAEGGDSWGVSSRSATTATRSPSDRWTKTASARGRDMPSHDRHRRSESRPVHRAPSRSSSAPAATWIQQAYLKASNTGQDDWFGVRLALSGDGNTLAVVAPNEDSAARGINGQDNNEGLESGAVYFFTRTGTSWSQLAYVKSANSDAFDEFGGSVAMSSDGRTMVVGARGEDSAATGVNGNQADNSMDEAGAVYVFTR